MSTPLLGRRVRLCGKRNLSPNSSDCDEDSLAIKAPISKRTKLSEIGRSDKIGSGHSDIPTQISIKGPTSCFADQQSMQDAPTTKSEHVF